MDNAAAVTAPQSYTDDGETEVRVEPPPEPVQYVRVGVVLAVITAIEVAVYYLDLPGRAMVPILVGLASMKFSLVAAYFMHLKFDSRLLRRVFVTGIVLAVFIFSAGLFTLGLLFH